MAVFVGAHVRTRQSLVWLATSSSTLMVFVFPVPGGPHMRLNLPSPPSRPVAEMQLSTASACAPSSLNGDSLAASASSAAAAAASR